MEMLLSQHPNVATAHETNIFLHYINALNKLWLSEEDTLPETEGLTNLLSRSAFIDLLRSLADGVLAAAARSTEECLVVAEKSPEHVRLGRLILAVHPEACFIHMIRDPRSVASSLVQASKHWGKTWAPRSAPAAARWWNGSVAAGREIATWTERYHEVRFEDLKQDTVGVLGRVLSWLDLNGETELCQEIVARCTLDRLANGSEDIKFPASLSAMPQGFFRSGKVDGWRTELSSRAIRNVEYITAQLMGELGYERSLPDFGRKPLGLTISDSARAIGLWLLKGLSWRIYAGIRFLQR